MSSKPIPPLLALLLLLTACSSQAGSAKCKASDASRTCGAETRWFALADPTGEMRVLYENERTVIFVKADIKADTQGDGERVIEDVMRLAGSGAIAVYDKSQKCRVTSLGVVEVHNPGIPGTPGEGASYSLTLYLPDCTPILGWGWMA